MVPEEYPVPRPHRDNLRQRPCTRFMAQSLALSHATELTFSTRSMSIAPLDTPSDEDLYRRIWMELQRATQDSHHDWRTPVMSRVNAQGVPQAAPQTALVFWSKRLSWQLRVAARVSVDTTGPMLNSPVCDLRAHLP